ncbi:MAG: M23 family metallopeptidase [Pseudomonadota bacterium]
MQTFFRSFLVTCLLIFASCTPGADGELQLEGAFQQGGLVVATAVPGARASINGQDLQVFDDGRFLIGFGRDAATEQTLTVRWPSGRVEERLITIAARTYQEQRINGVDQTRVTPPAEVQERINLESSQARAARDANTPIAFFDAGWIWPVSGRVTGVYGSARIFNGVPGSTHWGIDIAAPTGTSVLAPSAGVVRLVHQDNYFARGLIILDHGYGLTSSFLHLSRIDVQPGDTVGQGATIGAVGSTGRSTGPHLDWRMNLGSGTRLDVALLPLPEGP